MVLTRPAANSTSKMSALKSLMPTPGVAAPTSPTVSNIAHRKHAAAMPPTNCAAIYPGIRFHGKLRRAANANVTAGFKASTVTAAAGLGVDPGHDVRTSFAN